MGNFDDLIPKKSSLPMKQAGAFDDLIPKRRTTTLPAKKNAQEYAMFGPMARGVESVDYGADARDIPGVIASGVQGVIGNTPEMIAERPRAVATSGLLSANQFVPKEEKQIPFPRAVTPEGKKLSSELENLGFASSLSQMTSDVVPFAKRGLDYLKFKQAGGREGALKKAEEELIKILQPKTSQLDIASSKGLDSPDYIKKSIPYLKPSKTYEELASNLNKSKNTAVRQRNQIIRGNNYKITDDYLLPLQDEINALSRKPQTPDVVKEIEDMQKVLKAYQDYNQTRGYNRVQGQVEKTRLQRKTEPLLKKVNKGEPVDRSAAEIRALDKVRYGLKTMVEGGDPEIKRLNEAYQALKETGQLASHRSNLARKVTPSFAEKVPVLRDVLNFIARSRAYPEQVALTALNKQPSLNRTTKEIAKLYEVAEEFGKPKPVTLPRKPEVKQIESKNQEVPRLTGPKPSKEIGVTSQRGDNFERVSPSEAYSRIDERFRPIKEMLSSEPKRLPAPQSFELVSPDDSAQRIYDFAFKYHKPSKSSGIETIAEAFAGGQKKSGVRKAGINPYSGEIKLGKVKTALMAALERSRN